MGTGVPAVVVLLPGHRHRLVPHRVAADGKVFNFGRATGYGSPEPSSLHAPIVGMAVDHADRWLLARRGRRQRLQLQREVLRRRGRAIRSTSRSSGSPRRRRATVTGSSPRRRHLRVRQRALLRLDGRHPSQPADRRDQRRTEDRRLLARRVRRRHLRVPRAVPRVDRRHPSEPARSSASRPNAASPAATGSSHPTAASSRSTRRSTAPPAAITSEPADRRDLGDRRHARLPVRRVRRRRLQLRRRPLLGLDQRRAGRAGRGGHPRPVGHAAPRDSTSCG